MALRAIRVTLEVYAELPNCAPDQVVRTVIENCQTLKFRSFGYCRYQVTLTAYLPFRNGIIEESDVLDAKTLPTVQMPDRDQ